MGAHEKVIKGRMSDRVGINFSSAQEWRNRTVVAHKQLDV